MSPRMVHFSRHTLIVYRAKKSLTERVKHSIPPPPPPIQTWLMEEDASGKSLERERDDREAAAEREAARKGTKGRVDGSH